MHGATENTATELTATSSTQKTQTTTIAQGTNETIA